MNRPNRDKFDAVGYTHDSDGVVRVVFECRCCGAKSVPGITKDEWLSDPEAEEPEPKVEMR